MEGQSITNVRFHGRCGELFIFPALDAGKLPGLGAGRHGFETARAAVELARDPGQSKTFSMKADAGFRTAN